MNGSRERLAKTQSVLFSLLLVRSAISITILEKADQAAGCGKPVGYYSDKPRNEYMSESFPIVQDGTIINARGRE
jgi:hypothetical protein